MRQPPSVTYLTLPRRGPGGHVRSSHIPKSLPRRNQPEAHLNLRLDVRPVRCGPANRGQAARPETLIVQLVTALGLRPLLPAGESGPCDTFSGRYFVAN